MHSPKLVTIDAWDTILQRNCAPDDVAYHAAWFLRVHHRDVLKPEFRDVDVLFRERRRAASRAGNAWKAKGFDPEYTLRELYEQWLDAVLDTVTPEYRHDVVRELEAAELRYEAYVTRLDRGVLDVLEGYRELDLVLVADSYFPSAIVRGLARRAGFQKFLRATYSSCDHRLAKSTGRLFEKIGRDLGVRPEDHVHVGDDAKADVEVPRALGIHAVKYEAAPAIAYRASVNERAERRRTRTVSEMHGEALATLAVPPSLTPQQAALYRLGARYAMPFFAFVYSILEDAIARRISRLEYFTREGVFFKAIHDMIATENPFPGFLPGATVLEVSRVATFGPSLRAITLDELMRLWTQYSSHSMAVVLRTLGVRPEEYRTLLVRHAIDPAESIEYPWQDPRVQALFADAEFTTKLARELEVHRMRLVNYLAARGLTAELPYVAVVDIGWRGTIQDNLAHLLPNTHLHGYYFALHPFLNRQPDNTSKTGFYMDLNLDPAHPRVFEYPSVIEMLCNCTTGSVLHYETWRGESRPVVENEPAEDRVWERYIQYFQKGVLAIVPALCRALQERAVESHRLREQGLLDLVELVENPPAELARAYFSLAHNEGFGVGAFVSKRAPVPLYTFVRGLRKLRYRQQFVHKLEASGWPQGALRRLRADVLIDAYNDGRLVRPPREWIR